MENFLIPTDSSLKTTRKTFTTFLENNARRWTYNHQGLQSVNTKVCGHYCLYYLINRCRNVTMTTIVSRFSRNSLKNDSLVYHFIVKYFGYLYTHSQKQTHQSSRVKTPLNTLITLFVYSNYITGQMSTSVGAFAC